MHRLRACHAAAGVRPFHVKEFVMSYRFLLACSLVTLALSTTGTARPTGAAGSIIGTVKATGLTSNADAIVYLEQAAGTFTPAVLTMDQKSMQFSPHVMPVLIGSTVKFLNSDPTPHNVFTPDFEKFNLGTWPQGQTKDHVFDKCAKTPCAYTLLCRVHPEMEGFVVVLQNPYFAVSGRDGKYTIANVPAGTYSVGVWHPKLNGKPQPATVGAAPVTIDFTLAK
jgi:plastocyanin